MSLEQFDQIVKASFPHATLLLKKIPHYQEIKIYNEYNPPSVTDKIQLLQNTFTIAQNEELLGYLQTTTKSNIIHEKLLDKIIQNTDSIIDQNRNSATSSSPNLVTKELRAIYAALTLINTKLDQLGTIGDRLTNFENKLNKLEDEVKNINLGKGKEIITYDSIAY